MAYPSSPLLGMLRVRKLTKQKKKKQKKSKPSPLTVSEKRRAIPLFTAGGIPVSSSLPGW
jgi:hypothetical protein